MYNILVVDDDKEIVKAIEIYLEKENYFIYKAYDGEEALKQINDNVINLIIMDIMMPKKDGIETLEEIRKNKDIPVILLSAKSLIENEALFRLRQSSSSLRRPHLRWNSVLPADTNAGL